MAKAWQRSLHDMLKQHILAQIPQLSVVSLHAMWWCSSACIRVAVVAEFQYWLQYWESQHVNSNGICHVRLCCSLSKITWVIAVCRVQSGLKLWIGCSLLCHCYWQPWSGHGCSPFKIMSSCNCMLHAHMITVLEHAVEQQSLTHHTPSEFMWDSAVKSQIDCSLQCNCICTIVHYCLYIQRITF